MPSEKDQLFGLIRKQIEGGSRKEDIISNLIFAGYRYQEIEAAFQEMETKGEIPLNFWSQNNEIKTRTSILKSDYESVSEAVNAEPEPLTGAKSLSYSISKHRVIYSLLLFIFIALIGGFLGWYFLGFKSPYRIVEKSVVALSSVNSFKYRVNIETKSAQETSLKNMEILAVFDGVMDFKNISDFKRSFSLDIKDKNTDQTNWLVSVINKGENIFIRPENSQWIKISLQDDTSKLSFLPQKLGSYLVSFNKSAITDIFKIKFSFSQFKVNRDFFKSFALVNDGGDDFYHLRFVPKKELGVYFASALGTIFNSNDWFKNADFPSGNWDAYVNKINLLPYEIILSGDFGKIDISLSEFNKDFDVEEPFSWITPEKAATLLP